VNPSPYDEFVRGEPSLGTSEALHRLRLRLAQLPLSAWFECSEQFARAGQPRRAAVMLETALQSFPLTAQLGLRCAQALMAADDDERAEALLRKLLAAYPGHEELTMLLASVVKRQGRYDEAVDIITELWQRNQTNARLGLDCAEFCLASQREGQCAAICEQMIAAGCRKAEVFAVAGAAALALGRFGLARQHLLASLELNVDLNERMLFQALSKTQQYTDRSHPDFDRIHQILNRSDLTARGRASVLFGKAKLHDDVGDYAAAVSALTQANALMQRELPWRQGQWAGFVQTQLESRAPVDRADVALPWTPVFIVGLPRSGTSLLAERLARHLDVCDRSEMDIIPFLAERLGTGEGQSAPRLRAAASVFARHVRQDDPPARWYIDKNPVNFRHLGLIARLLPNARVIWCRRNLRDTALSTWSQIFFSPLNAYSFSLQDIATYASDSARLMAHWQNTLDLPIYECRYEQMIEDPDAQLMQIRTFLGLPERLDQIENPIRSVATASAWQVRQPIYKTSTGRWRHYEHHLPDLTRLFPDPLAQA
jgi:tetratricopeptide (TPR) repeat protein